MQLILASRSPYRRQLLERLGLPFTAVSPIYSEADPGTCSDPRAMVRAHALGKARSLVAGHRDALIIGSDQAAVCGGEVLGKPRSEDRAIDQLLRLAGRDHELLTAVVVIRTPPDAPPGRTTEKAALVCSRLRMRELSAAEATAYVRLDQPLDCAGSYKLESLGITLFEEVGGTDPTAIVGLPLIALTRLLREFGVDPLDAGWEAQR